MLLPWVGVLSVRYVMLAYAPSFFFWGIAFNGPATRHLVLVTRGAAVFRPNTHTSGVSAASAAVFVGKLFIVLGECMIP